MSDSKKGGAAPTELTPEVVANTAKLSALSLTGEQEKRFTKELSSIIGYMENLNKVDVSGVEPTSHVHGATNFFRDDIAKEPLAVQEGLANTPDRSGRFIRVPIIIDQSGEH